MSTIAFDKNLKKEGEKRKILLIGLDGASPILIEKWTKQNKLPNFKRIMEDGVYGRVKSTIPPITAPAWSTFMTGKNPGKHGVYDFIKREEKSYSLTVTNPGTREGETLWEIIGEQGLKVGVFNIPLTYPATEVNGFMVTGMPHPAVQTFPHSLKEELDRVVGGYETFIAELDAEQNPEPFLEGLYLLTSKMYKAVRYLMKKYDWNFFCMNFSGTDWIQHKMWHYMDPSHPKHKKVLWNKYGNAILNYYQKMDQIIGELLEVIDENKVVLIFSDHGFGKAKKFIHVNNFLKDIGVLKLKNDFRTLLKRSLFNIGFTPSRMYKLSMKMPMRQRTREIAYNIIGGKKLRAHMLNILKRMFLSFSDVDWKRTTAYSIGHIGQIYVNLKGREPSGIVTPGREYEKVREYIVKNLKSLQDPETGERIIEKIYMNEEIYKGKYKDKGADICFISKDLQYLGFGDLEFASKDTIEDCFGFTGNHRVEGILILNGNEISSQKKLNDSSLEDIAPTVLYYLGIPIPNDMDGRVLKEAFEKEFLKKNPITFVNVSKKERKPEIGFSEEEEIMIKNRLRKLGYIA